MDQPNRTSGFFKIHRYGVLLFITVLLMLLCIFLTSSKIIHITALCILMTLWYAMDVVPPAATSILPAIVIPYMGIIDSNTTCMSYMSNNTFFLILCFQFAVAFQSTDTADIIAYKLLHSVSNITPKRLLITFMASGYIISALTPNALACSLLLPISKSVINWYQSVNIHTLNRDEPVREDSDPVPTKVTIAFGIGIAFSCTIGGMVTMGSSPSNFAIYDVYTKLLEGQEDGPKFFAFLVIGVLVSAPLLVITCLYIEYLFLDLFRKLPEDRENTNEKYKGALRNTANPDLTFKVHNIIVIWLWVMSCVMCSYSTFAPFHTGNPRIKEMYIKGSSYLMAFIFLLLNLSKSCTFWNYFRCHKPPLETERPGSILQWYAVQRLVPWSYLFVYGASECLAYSFQRVHLQCKIGNLVNEYSEHLRCASWLASAALLTSIGSNNLIATNFMYWALKMGFEKNTNDGKPLYSIALGSNLCFLMPISSITNCMAVGWFNIPFKSVFIAGLVPIFVGIILSDILVAFLVDTLQPGFHGNVTFPTVSA